MMDCVRQTIRHNGFRGPFQGLGATLLRDTPANSIYLGSFEVLFFSAVLHNQHKPLF